MVHWIYNSHTKFESIPLMGTLFQARQNQCPEKNNKKNKENVDYKGAPESHQQYALISINQ